MTATELEHLRVQVARLQEQLGEEQLLRRQAEEAVEAVAADRNRLQRARDELAAALLMAERRALDAEEEQLKAETAAAALAQQLQEAQREAAAAAAAAAGTAGGASGSTQQQQQQQQGPQEAPLQAQARRQLGRGSSEGEAALVRDAEILLGELDRERQRSEELVRTLEAAEREAVSATEKLIKAQARIKKLESKGSKGGKDSGSGRGSKDGGGDGGLQESASAASLEALAAGGAGGEGAAVTVLQQRIAALKASRDKLIGAFDAQAAEVERLSVDNAALAETVAQLQDVATKWEAQAQDSLAQNERLKDLLEESATWSVPAAAAAPAPAAADSGAGRSAAAGAEAAGGGGAVETGSGEGAIAQADGSGDTGALAALCQRFERELLLEKAKSAQLDMQVRALCMELTRAAQSSSQMQAALMPMLGGIEARLVQVLGMRARPGALGSAAA